MIDACILLPAGCKPVQLLSVEVSSVALPPADLETHRADCSQDQHDERLLLAFLRLADFQQSHLHVERH